MKYIIVIAFLFCFGTSAFAGKGYTIKDIDDYLKILKYNGSKVAKLKNKGGWYIYCSKGRKRGSSSDRYDTLRRATQFAMSECHR